ncbi:MAG: hypothetical protein ABW175_25015 [Bradyrhizobium sp.]
MHERVGPSEFHQLPLADEFTLIFDQYLEQIERPRTDPDRPLVPQQQLPAGKEPVIAKAVRAFADFNQPGLHNARAQNARRTTQPMVSPIDSTPAWLLPKLPAFMIP